MRYICTFLILFLIGSSWAFAADSTGVHLRVAAGQFQLEPDLEKNLKKIDDYLSEAAAQSVDLIVFPELALTGYPPKDIIISDLLIDEPEGYVDFHDNVYKLEKTSEE